MSSSHRANEESCNKSSEAVVINYLKKEPHNRSKISQIIKLNDEVSTEELQTRRLSQRTVDRYSELDAASRLSFQKLYKFTRW